MSRQTNRTIRRKRFLVVSLCLWVWLFLATWIAERYPTVGRGYNFVAYPKLTLASLLVAFGFCFAIRRQIYTKAEQRKSFFWLPVAGLFGTPIFFGIMLSFAALNGCLDDSLPERHASELIAKRSIVGRGWVLKSLVVKDWRQGNQTAVIGGLPAARLYHSLELGQTLHVTTRKGFFEAEWIVGVHGGKSDNQ